MATHEQPPLYRRVLLKLSGEALQGTMPNGIDANVVNRIATEIVDLTKHGVEIAIVIGGGNLFRGKQLADCGLSHITADHVGTLSTMMNALILRDFLEQQGARVHVMSAWPLPGILHAVDHRQAMEFISCGDVVIFAAGTGNPCVTTDFGASLRSIQIEADILLKATQVDGVYSADPAKNANAKLYRQLTYQQVLKQELAVMDLAAFCQCRDYGMRIRVFNITTPGNLRKAVFTTTEGTLIEGGEHDRAN